MPKNEIFPPYVCKVTDGRTGGFLKRKKRASACFSSELRKDLLFYTGNMTMATLIPIKQVQRYKYVNLMPINL